MLKSLGLHINVPRGKIVYTNIQDVVLWMMREVSHSTPAIFPAYWLIPVSCLAPIPPFVPNNLFSHHSPGTSSQQDFSFNMQYNCQAVVGQESKVLQKKFSNLFIAVNFQLNLENQPLFPMFPCYRISSMKRVTDKPFFCNNLFISVLSTTTV